jgi:hypothetical protein
MNIPTGLINNNENNATVAVTIDTFPISIGVKNSVAARSVSNNSAN